MRDIRFLLKTHYKNSYALIIGINDYEKISPLYYAVNDAKDIRDILVEKLSFERQNIVYLVDKEATKDNILNSFARFTKEDIELDDRIFIFFAGHGHTITGFRGDVGFLVPYDADIKDINTLIRWEELTRNSELIRAKHMLFIMDACYGGLALTRNLQSGSTRFLKDMMLRYSRQVLTAGKANEEVSDSGGPLPDHSIFTGHLIEGLLGKAITDKGILTASSLMSYVYAKVANDKNSNQTPHYGYFDGDGDFILHAPQLNELERDSFKDLDSLISIPFSEENFSSERTPNKIKKIKLLLASDALSIELHDFVVEEIRNFLSATSDDYFELQEQQSQNSIVERISRYEHISHDISLLAACISYWAKPTHKVILQKILVRATDRLGVEHGANIWANLCWYPSIIELYFSGIAAIEANRYDSLANIFYAKTNPSRFLQNEEFFVGEVSNAILRLLRENTFKQLPGYDQFYTPMSEYLFKIIQPKLDDILFIGKNYENSFDRFEILFALVVYDIRIQKQQRCWAPMGRFAWKFRQGNSQLSLIFDEAQNMGENWEVTKSGLFGGDLRRFIVATQQLNSDVSQLPWH